MTRAVYAGSLDPIHYGHIDIIERASRVFEETIVTIGVNPDKKYTFTLEERLDMARHSLSRLPSVRVEPFGGLLVDYAYEQGIPVTVKGVRNSEDFNYEQMLHQVGESQKLGVDSFVLFARPELAHLSSGAVKALQKEQGLIHGYVPPYVKQKLEEKISGQFIVGLTGEIGVGKSYVGEMLSGRHIDLDKIGHQILGKLTEGLYVETREKIIENFGKGVRLPNGMIDRKVLGEIVFNDPQGLEQLNTIMSKPILVRLRRELHGEQGLTFIDAALLAESDLGYLCNNNFLLVSAERNVQERRLRKRGLSSKQIERRLQSQYGTSKKRETIEEAIKREGHGRLWTLDNSIEMDNSGVDRVYKEIRGYFGSQLNLQLNQPQWGAT